MSGTSSGVAQMSASAKLLECSTLISYLKTLQSETLSELYDHPATCLAVFRELPPLAKQFVLRLLHVEQPVPKAVVTSWVSSAQCGGQALESTEELTTLGVWKEASMPGGLPAWILDVTFRKNLKIVLTGG